MKSFPSRALFVRLVGATLAEGDVLSQRCVFGSESVVSAWSEWRRVQAELELKTAERMTVEVRIRCLPARRVGFGLETRPNGADGVV